MDIGGTFTDLVAVDKATGKVTAGKVSTTPHDLTEGVLAGLNEVTSESYDIGFLVHGTTQGLNAFLERRGERVLLLATQGAGDVYHIARGNRTRLYDIHFRKTEPLVPKHDIVEIKGRLNYRGEERIELDEQGIRDVAARVADEGFGAVAVAFLFSYVNPDHELQTARILHESLGADFPITLSHQVAREWREYERTSSTVIDAYIAPTVRRYLTRLEEELEGRQVPSTLHVMQSNGGIITASSARDQCIQTLLSGPVGGTVGGSALADRLDLPNLLCIDMGGTSFDVSLVGGGEPDIEGEASLEGFPILMPVVQIHTVGAGGGSIAYDEAGGLRVGPRSAGAHPGPACYGRGGMEPTVTDANLLLGRVDPDWFAGGALTLNRQAAERALETLGVALGLNLSRTAEGVCAVINAKMAQAIRTITVEKGVEPRDYGLLAYGGAGPMHACFLADELGIATVIVPSNPGAFSAWGMLQTDLRQDFAEPMYSPLDRLDCVDLAANLLAKEREGAEALRSQGATEPDISYRHGLDVRYRGQEYTLTVPVRNGNEPQAETFAADLADRFHDAYKLRYGHSNVGAPIEIVMIRTAAVGKIERHPAQRSSTAETIQPRGVQRAMVFDGVQHEAQTLYRQDLRPGAAFEGPALVLEETATTVVPPSWSVRVDHSECLQMTKISQP
jgi:N-methylhydantoinase A